jgi:phosphonate transport system substrate-binding protein
LSVATVWLYLELAGAGQPPPSRFFRRQITSAKPSKVILPVFFKQVAACLVTKEAFDTMAELNPQIRARLRIIAASPPYVPSFFAVKTGLSAAFLERVLREFDQLHTTPAGRQVLTIFQTDQVVAKPESTLTNTLAMLEAHRRISSDGTTARGSATAP